MALRGFLPEAAFLLIANSASELKTLEEVGLEGFVSSSLIFVDERVFRPLGKQEPQVFHAVYNARMDPFKRHELAREVSPLTLIYDYPEGDFEKHLERVKELLPHADYANHRITGTSYTKFTSCEVNRELARARCGLMLSSAEGSPRALSEYLLAGLPVVSTFAPDGRQALLDSPYVAVAKSTASSVRETVLGQVARNIPRTVIREWTVRWLRIARTNLLTNVQEACSRSFDTPLRVSERWFVTHAREYRPIESIMAFRA